MGWKDRLLAWLLDDKPLRRILVSRLRYLGDVIMSTAVLDVLHRGDPVLELSFLLEAPFAGVLEGRMGLRRLHKLEVQRHSGDARARRQDPTGSVSGGGTLAMVRELRRCRYDLAIDLFFNPRSSLLLFMAGIPERIGGAGSWRRHLFTRTVIPEDGWQQDPYLQELAGGALGHHLCRLQPLVHQETGLPFLQWLRRNYRPGEIRPRLERRAINFSASPNRFPATGDRYLLLAPGATWPSKAWPISRWEDLISELLTTFEEDVWVVTPPGRGMNLAGLAALIPGQRGGVLPSLALTDVLSILAGAKAVVAVDGGVMHAAVGLDVPTVALFGPTDPEIWFPYENAGPFRVVCQKPPCHPCGRHNCEDFICLPDLSAKKVMATLGELLAI